ncbi:hypothetical protein ACFLU3_01700 [Chloroflexota bacterium]
MNATELAAIVATVILALLICFQILLVLGLPLGRVAWGGQHSVLPTKLRWGSLAAVVILGVAAWIVLARADLVAPGDEPLAIRITTWIFAGYWVLNTFGNIVSKSPTERYVMTPVSVLLIACFVVVSL